MVLRRLKVYGIQVQCHLACRNSLELRPISCDYWGECAQLCESPVKGVLICLLLLNREILQSGLIFHLKPHTESWVLKCKHHLTTICLLQRRNRQYWNASPGTDAASSYIHDFRLLPASVWHWRQNITNSPKQEFTIRRHFQITSEENHLFNDTFKCFRIIWRGSLQSDWATRTLGIGI